MRLRRCAVPTRGRYVLCPSCVSLPSPSLTASAAPIPLTRFPTLASSRFAGEITHSAFRYTGTGARPENERNTHNERRDTEKLRR